MTQSGFIMYQDYEQYLQPLTDAEVGQLMRAIFSYRSTGTVPELERTVEIAFGFIRGNLDRDREKYEKRCERSKSNGAKGGRPRNREVSTESTETDGFLEKPKKPSGFSGFLEKPKKPDTENDTDTEKDTTTPLNPPEGESDGKTSDEMEGLSEPVKTALTDWIKYKRERGKAYKPTGRKSLITQVRNKVRELGETAVTQVIQDSMACNYQGIIWDMAQKTNTSPRGKPKPEIYHSGRYDYAAIEIAAANKLRQRAGGAS